MTVSMRNLINLFESAQAVTPELLTQTIQTTIKEWIASGKVKSVRKIGDGLCYDFTRAVMAAMGLENDHLHGTGPIKTLRTEDFEKREWYADLAKLRRMKEPVPTDIPPRILAELIGSASHEWMFFQGKHYDATAPKGVPHFLDLPFFKNQIEGLRKELAKGQP